MENLIDSFQHHFKVLKTYGEQLAETGRYPYWDIVFPIRKKDEVVSELQSDINKVFGIIQNPKNLTAHYWAVDSVVYVVLALGILEPELFRKQHEFLDHVVYEIWQKGAPPDLAVYPTPPPKQKPPHINGGLAWIFPWYK